MLVRVKQAVRFLQSFIIKVEGWGGGGAIQ